MSKLAAWLLVGTVAFSTGSSAGVISSPGLSGRSSFIELMASLASTSGPIDLSKVGADSKMTFVRASGMQGYTKDGMRLSPAAHRAMVGAEASVSLSAPLLGHLIDAGYSTTDVIALSVDATGGIIVFVNK